jgi:hypothetical protein
MHERAEGRRAAEVTARHENERVGRVRDRVQRTRFGYETWTWPASGWRPVKLMGGLSTFESRALNCPRLAVVLVDPAAASSMVERHCAVEPLLHVADGVLAVTEVEGAPPEARSC